MSSKPHDLSDARLSKLEKMVSGLEKTISHLDRRMSQRDHDFFKLRDEEITSHVAPIMEEVKVMRRRLDKFGGDLDYIRQKVDGTLNDIAKHSASIDSRLVAIDSKLTHPESEPPVEGKS